MPARIAALAAGDPELRRFGASQHRYAVGARVDESELAALEQRLGTPLPDAYRAYLRDVGDGGAGPYWGLHSIHDALARVDERRGTLAGVARDCALERDVAFAELGRDPRALADDFADPRFDDGTLPICDYGCGDCFFLVVRGPRLGTVWVDSVDSATGMFCLEVDYVGFVERWLDACELDPDPAARAPGARYAYLRYGANPRYQLT